MTNSADQDQLASQEANWSGSTLFLLTKGMSCSAREGLTVSCFNADQNEYDQLYEINLYQYTCILQWS